MNTNLQLDKYHIILIGFKHVGKTSIGAELAKRLSKDFIDLDRVLELEHPKLLCRQIMEIYGNEYFRKKESIALEKSLCSRPSVIALGGGALLSQNNCLLIKRHLIIHITAPSQIVFDRILKGDLPAYYPTDQDPRDYFEQLWVRTKAICDNLTDNVVNNDQAIDVSVREALKLLSDKAEKLP